jgi:hypothetical protein
VYPPPYHALLPYCSSETLAHCRDRDIEKLSCTTTIHSHALTEYRQCMLGMLRDKRLYNDTDQFLFVGTNCEWPRVPAMSGV